MSTSSNKEISYQPIRSAADWLDLVDPDFIEFGNRVSELKSNSNELFDIAAKEAMNWAAIETGAIEGLYKTDRGLHVFGGSSGKSFTNRS